VDDFSRVMNVIVDRSHCLTIILIDSILCEVPYAVTREGVVCLSPTITHYISSCISSNINLERNKIRTRLQRRLLPASGWLGP
jgi:hypothetical protein